MKLKFAKRPGIVPAVFFVFAVARVVTIRSWATFTRSIFPIRLSTSDPVSPGREVASEPGLPSLAPCVWLDSGFGAAPPRTDVETCAIARVLDVGPG